MHYAELVEASRVFRTSEATYDWAWIRARKTDWSRLDELDDEEIKEEVIGFLNRWSCRIPPTSELATALRDTFQHRKQTISALSPYCLENFEKDQERMVEGLGVSLAKAMTQLFRDFSAIGSRFRDVAASKTLHMVLPKLFVMWDNAIRESYGIEKDPYGYVYSFIPRMAELAREAVTTYAEERKVTFIQAAKEISNLCAGRTLAKIVDEYNYLRYTSGMT